jgi:hypothetical protein
LIVQRFSTTTTTTYLTTVPIIITPPNGYRAIGIVGWGCHYGFRCYGVIYDYNYIKFTISSSTDGENTGDCVAYVLFEKISN